jgi:hypothetical protein
VVDSGSIVQSTTWKPVWLKYCLYNPIPLGLLRVPYFQPSSPSANPVTSHKIINLFASNFCRGRTIKLGLPFGAEAGVAGCHQVARDRANMANDWICTLSRKRYVVSRRQTVYTAQARTSLYRVCCLPRGSDRT